MPLNVHLHMYFIDAALWFNFQSRHKKQFCITLTHHEAEVQKCLLIVTETKCISEEGEVSQGDYFLHYHLSAICSVFISLM